MGLHKSRRGVESRIPVQPRIQMTAPGTAVPNGEVGATAEASCSVINQALGPVHTRPVPFIAGAGKGQAGCGPEAPSLARPRSMPGFLPFPLRLRRQVGNIASLSRGASPTESCPRPVRCKAAARAPYSAPSTLAERPGVTFLLGPCLGGRGSPADQAQPTRGKKNQVQAQGSTLLRNQNGINNFTPVQSIHRERKQQCVIRSRAA